MRFLLIRSSFLQFFTFMQCHSAIGWDPSIGLAVFMAVVRKGSILKKICANNRLAPPLPHLGNPGSVPAHIQSIVYYHGYSRTNFMDSRIHLWRIPTIYYYCQQWVGGTRDFPSKSASGLFHVHYRILEGQSWVRTILGRVEFLRSGQTK